LSFVALLVTVVLWASAFVGIRALGDTFSPGPLSLGRLLVGATVLTAIARPRLDRVPRGRPLLLVVAYGVVWFGAYNVALNAGERHLDAGTAALLVNIGPILVALFAGLLLHEGFPRPLVAGMAIAFVGVAIIAISSQHDTTAVETASTTGVLLCTLAAVFYAVGALAQKPALAHVAPAMSVWLGCVVGAVVCLPFAPGLVRELGAASASDVAWLVYLGVFPTAIGFTTWSYALQRISTGQAASTTYLVPVVAALVSWVVLDEVPAVLATVGGVVCLVGVAITRWRQRPPSTTVPAPADGSPAR